MAKVMSHESEKFILNSIEKVCDLVEDQNLHPNDAVEKVANELKLTPEYISLVCHGYNIGRQTHQRKTASTVLEKLAEFPLADPGVVVDRIYPSKVDTPREQKIASSISHEYSLPPRSKSSAYNPQGFKPNKSIKLALDHAFEDDPEKAFNKAFSAAKKASADADEARMKKARAYTKVVDSLEALRTYVKYREPFSAIKEAVEKDFGKLGKEIIEFVTPVKNPIPLAKSAMLGLNLDELRSLVKTSAFAINSYNKAKAAFEQAVDQAKETIDSVMEPYTFSPPIKSVVNRQKRSGVFSSTLLAANVLKDKAAPEDMSGKIDDTYKDLEFSPVANQIRGLQARTQLEDYMRNDEVISGYSPEEVIEAYNEIAAVAPRLSTQPAMMRAMLRKRLAQQFLGTFEANELANMERTLGETHGSPR